MILPALTIALPAAAVYQRLLRTDLITNLQEDFILMARSKGVSRTHRAASGTPCGPRCSRSSPCSRSTPAALIGGALVVEQIFLIPGLGSAIVEAVAREDFPVVLAIVMLIAIAFVVINLVVDVVYTDASIRGFTHDRLSSPRSPPSRPSSQRTRPSPPTSAGRCASSVRCSGSPSGGWCWSSGGDPRAVAADQGSRGELHRPQPRSSAVLAVVASSGSAPTPTPATCSRARSGAHACR